MNTYGKIANREGKIASFQVSILKDIPAGNFAPGEIFLIKNISDDNITLSVKPAGQEDFVTTVLYPGWNPELCEEIQEVEGGTLQYGY